MDIQNLSLFYNGFRIKCGMTYLVFYSKLGILDPLNYSPTQSGHGESYEAIMKKGADYINPPLSLQL